MASGKDTAEYCDANLDLLRNVVRATGLPQDLVEGFLLTDRDLDDLCDTVLAQLAVPRKKTVSSAASL